MQVLARFKRRFLAEMKVPEARRTLDLLRRFHIRQICLLAAIAKMKTVVTGRFFASCW